MKKAIVLLLALAVLGGAVFAQVTTKVALSGGVTLLNEDTQGVSYKNGSWYDTFNLSASKDGVVGFSITDANILDTGFNALDSWNVWYKIMDSKLKVAFGNSTMSDVRTYLPNEIVANLTRTQGVGGDKLYFVYTQDALTVNFSLPYGTTATDVADVAQMADIGVKYVLADVGTLTFLADLNLVTETNKVNFGFSYSGMENLSAVLVYQGTFATASAHKFGLGFDYTMDALYAGLEFSGAYTTAFAWDVAATASYDITDAIFAGADIYMDDSIADALDISANAGYNFGNGFKVVATAGYATEVYYNLKAKYSISF